jgi:glucose-1-phosphate cytidylyltransferase
MKVVILCGGLGTRLREETEYRPKPMVPIGGRPVLWHIMKHFAHFGHNEFYCALGYKGDAIKSYFLQYHALDQDIAIDLATGAVTMREAERVNWRVHMVDTGASTNTGGRVKRLQDHLGSQPFLLAYGDSLSNVDLHALLAFHKARGKTVTLTAVKPPARFGELILRDDLVTVFDEKPDRGDGWVNGGFMVIEPAFFDYLNDDSTGLEILAQVARDGRLTAYRHDGYWQCMDTIRDKERLDAEWESGHAGWKVAD